MDMAFVQDTKYAVRSLARTPGFAAIVILTLAVGIGANTAIFSVVRGVLLRPLPYREPEALVRIFGQWKQFARGSVSVPEVKDYEERARSLEGLAAWSTANANLVGEGEPVRASVGLATPTFFPLLGISARLGRVFSTDEGQPGHDQVIVLGDELWHRRYAGDPTIVGRTIHLDGLPYTVIGVLPPSFRFPGDAELWAPMAWKPEDRAEARRGNHSLRVVARIKSGLDFAQAQADFDGIGRELRALHAANYPADAGWSPLLVPLLDDMVGGVRPSLWMLVVASALVLVIACANVANLLLARGTTRGREMSLRAALGAGRGRLVRQLLTESLALSLVGGACGLVLAAWGVDLLVALSPDSLPRAADIGVDVWVLGFSLGLTALTGVVFGLLPALQTSRVDLHEALRAGGRVSSGVRPRRLRRALVVGEIALAIVLLVGAGLVTRSFANVLGVDPGFPVDGLATLRVALPTPNGPSSDEDKARYARFFDEAAQRLSHLPGVRAAGAINRVPLGADGNDNTFEIEGSPTPPGAQMPDEEVRLVTAGYFETIGLPILYGRTFTSFDRAGSPPVVIVSESFARRYWRDVDAVGKRLRFDDESHPWSTVIGVVGDLREFGLDADVRPQMYFTSGQSSWGASTMSLLVRGSGGEAELARLARAELAAMAPDQPVFGVRPMRAQLGDLIERRRFVAVLFELFGGLALALAAVGIYGVMSHSVAQRTHEIGVRVALGARRGQVLRLIAGEGAMVTALGLVLGIAAALAAGRLVAALLFKVSPGDPLVLTTAALVLAVVAALATYLPARRAMRVDPMQALREE